jgi:hypothetical protein
MLSITIALLAIFAGFIIGAIFGGMLLLLSRRIIFNRQLRIAERKAAKTVAEARNEAKQVLDKAQEEENRIIAAAENDDRERRAEVQKAENRLNQKS